MHWLYQTPSSNNTREDSTHGHHQIVNIKNDRMISVRFQGKPLNITVIQVYALTTDVKETEVYQFYEDLQNLIELTPKKDVLFIIEDWNAKYEVKRYLE